MPTTRAVSSGDVSSQPEPPMELSVVLPCLNEAETVAACIQQALATLQQHRIAGEVIVADNGSTDGSQEIAERAGARLVRVARRGYGSALMGGIAAARGRYVLMGDADCSYDFTHLPRFLEKLRAGADLVMGNRFRGGIADRAMPPMHRYLGNPVLSFLGRLFFKSPCSDFHCGLRGFDKRAYDSMDLRTTGMEFASEMVVKASLFGMRIEEVPTTLLPDRRSHPPHLRTWRDGWRHLRFLLMYSPRWLFLYPGILLLLLGLAVGAWLLPGSRRLGGVTFDLNTLLYGAAAALMGFQAIVFAVFTKVFAISEGLLPEDPRLDRVFAYITLEVGLAIGAFLALGGLAIAVFSLGNWGHHHFGPLDGPRMARVVISAVVTLTFGVETILASFFLSILGMKRR